MRSPTSKSRSRNRDPRWLMRRASSDAFWEDFGPMLRRVCHEFGSVYVALCRTIPYALMVGEAATRDALSAVLMYGHVWWSILKIEGVSWEHEMPIVL